MCKRSTTAALLASFILIVQFMACGEAEKTEKKTKKAKSETTQAAAKADDKKHEESSADPSFKKAGYEEEHAGEAAGPSFTDPTATLANKENIKFGQLVYVGPFATLKAGSDKDHAIEIGNETNIQDRVTLDTARGSINLGEMVILAHGATVKGSASIGEKGSCPKGGVCPSFVSFNAEVDGAIIEKDAMVSALARVGSGVTIPSGRSVLPGKNVTAQAEVESKTTLVTEADREFMHGVIEVNVEFAKAYTKMAAENVNHVRGINYDPGHTEFNERRDLPTFAGEQVCDPEFRNRIIGDVRISNSKGTAGSVMGKRVSLRADEGESFNIGKIRRMGDEVVFHALEHSYIMIGDNVTYGNRVVVHGGGRKPVDGGGGSTRPTAIQDNVTLKDGSVVFKSLVGQGSTVGMKSAVVGSELPAKTIVPDRTIYLNNAVFGKVEW